jgi:hypothetical protein
MQREYLQLGIGDRIRVDDVPHVVIGVSGTLVRLADEAGQVQTVTMVGLLTDARFELAGAGARRVPAVEVGLEGLPPAAAEEARWWERHIIEVLHGLPPDAPPGTRPASCYDPEVRSLAAREKAKAAELAAAGRPVAASTVKHRRQRYEAAGLAGLADHRAAKRRTPAGRVDPVVVAAMEAAIAEAADDSSRTVKFIIWRTGEILARDGAGAVLPSRRTLYRLFGRLAHGKHTTGSASTRRSLAGRPEGMFGQLPVAAPGELMQIDSTPLDVMVLLDDGVPGRVDLTGMIDVATRTVTAAVLRPSARSVDASVLLARTVTPEPMRPGWTTALKMAHSVLPYERLLSVDERLEHAAARPVIVPDTIVCDHGSVFISRNFRASCRHLGITFQPAHLASGAEKPHIERAFGTLGQLFCQFVCGYLGSNPDRRGRGIEGKPLWSMLELQELLDEWLIACWQNRPHDGLRDPEHPGRMSARRRLWRDAGSGSGPDVLTAPIRVVRTSAGTVAYRELGSGPELLLITGAGASMDGWPPVFVDALAAHHKVVVFDNAGVGRTTAVSAPALLSVTAMASQTSALISTLGLRRPAVLGWSMGGMIAQALAVSHPAQVSGSSWPLPRQGPGRHCPYRPSPPYPA